MKYWKVNSNEQSYTYIIFTENSIAKTSVSKDTKEESMLNSNYDEVIKFKEIDEIVINKKDLNIRFQGKEDSETNWLFNVKSTEKLSEIELSLKRGLSNTEISTYNYFNQFFNHKNGNNTMKTIALTVLFFVIKYIVNGGTYEILGTNFNFSKLKPIVNFLDGSIIILVSIVIITNLIYKAKKDFIAPNEGIVFSTKPDTQFIEK